jgi:hypothetical protein
VSLARIHVKVGDEPKFCISPLLADAVGVGPGVHQVDQVVFLELNNLLLLRCPLYGPRCLVGRRVVDHDSIFVFFSFDVRFFCELRVDDLLLSWPNEEPSINSDSMMLHHLRCEHDHARTKATGESPRIKAQARSGRCRQYARAAGRGVQGRGRTRACVVSKPLEEQQPFFLPGITETWCRERIRGWRAVSCTRPAPSLDAES